MRWVSGRDWPPRYQQRQENPRQGAFARPIAHLSHIGSIPTLLVYGHRKLHASAGWMDPPALDGVRTPFGLELTLSFPQIRDGFRTQQRFVVDILIPRRGLTLACVS